MLKNNFPARACRGQKEKCTPPGWDKVPENSRIKTPRFLCVSASLRELFRFSEIFDRHRGLLRHFVLLLLLSGLPVLAQTGTQDSLRVSVADSAVAASRPASKKKNPTGAAFRSLAIPGWGQYYNGQKIKAALAMAAELGEIGTAIYWNRRAQQVSDPQEKFIYKDYRNQALWFLAGTIVLSMLDAYVDGHLADFDEGPSLQESNAGLSLPQDARFAIRLQIRL
jgi:hypothetical protein